MSEKPEVIPVGRELDRFVGEKVFGHPSTLFYSYDIGMAFRVLERLHLHFSNVSLMAANGWHCWVWNVDGAGKERKCFQGYGDTPAEAICRCALAVAEKVDLAKTEGG